MPRKPTKAEAAALAGVVLGIREAAYSILEFVQDIAAMEPVDGPNQEPHVRIRALVAVRNELHRCVTRTDEIVRRESFNDTAPADDLDPFWLGRLTRALGRHPSESDLRTAVRWYRRGVSPEATATYLRKPKLRSKR